MGESNDDGCGCGCLIMIFVSVICAGILFRMFGCASGLY